MGDHPGLPPLPWPGYGVRALEALEALPSTAVLVGCLLLALALGGLDYLSGPRLHFFVFYVIPIFIAAWRCGVLPACVLSLLGVALWFLANDVQDMSHSEPLEVIWNTAVRLGVFLGTARTVTFFRAALEREQFIARSDALTGVVNRRSFEEVLSAEVERARRYQRPFTLAYVDVDNFKNLNDTLGHAAGDDLLRVAAQAMRLTIRRIDTVARLGGDEFAILLPEMDQEAARSFLPILHRRLTTAAAGIHAPASFSIGAVTVHGLVPDTREVLSLADRAMYAAKRAGKNTFQHHVIPPRKPGG